MITSHRNPKKILPDVFMGIDYGESNIGIAFGRNGFVSPLKVVSGKNHQTAIHEIARLARENHITKIIVGLPLSGSGKETGMSLKTRKFVKLLKVFLKTPVEFFNEHLSTAEAIEDSLTKGTGKKKKTKIDHLSAAIILKHYFDSVE